MRIVTAMDLARWADTTAIGVRSALPDLVRSLVRASSPDLAYYRFPGGEASQTHGWDGIVETSSGGGFVPAGRSIWELGAGADYARKATTDFEVRTLELTDERRTAHTFIFVTPRIWDKGFEKWIREHSNRGWREVRVFDAVSLEQWLEECPAVALSLAKSLGIIPPEGVQTVQDFWDDHRVNTLPPIAEELVITGREERSKLFRDALSAGLPGPSVWKADTAIEAALFIAATILRSDSELSSFLLSKTLFVDSVVGAKQIPSRGGFNLILLPDAQRFGPALGRRNQVVVAVGSDARATNAETLERTNTRDFATGLRAMGIEEQEAFRLASVCGRSIAVLLRLIPSATFTPPTWCSFPELIPIVLAGGWDAANEYDRAAVSALCDMPYDQVDEVARRFVGVTDPPLDLDGNVWSVRSQQDAFVLIGSLIGDAHQQRLGSTFQAVFSEIDRSLDVPDDKRSIIPTRGDDFPHSEWLRRGLAKTLLLVTGLHEAAGFRTIGLTPEEYVEHLVGGLPGLERDIRLLASLKSEFPRLMEAAPHPLARALEQVLEGANDDWVSIIFRDGKDSSPLGQFSPHTYILWALEALAWNPDHLEKAASILITLAEFDPGGGTLNRPSKSLRAIFLAWMPNTYAPVDLRASILRSICRRHPKAGLGVAMSLLPVSHDHSTGTAKPSLRDFGDARSKPPSNHEIWLAYHAYAEIAVEIAGTDLRRLTTLVDHFAVLSPHSQRSVAEAIRSAVVSASPDEVFDLWSKLCELASKHREFQGARWAMPENELRVLWELCEEIAPSDRVQRIVWLFDDLVPKMAVIRKNSLGGQASPPEINRDYIGDANRARGEALDGVLGDLGLPGVMELAKRAKQPFLVGFALAETAPTQEILETAMDLGLADDSGVNEDFAIAISAAAHQKLGQKWDECLRRVAGRLEPGCAANLLLRWADSRDTWTFVQTLGKVVEREYWKRKPAFRQNDDEDLFFALEKYGAVGRFSACVDLLAYQEERVPTDVCVEVLRGFVHEVDENKWKQQNTLYSVLQIIGALQKRDDTNINDLAAIEYQYLPLLDHMGEPVALNQLLKSSPKFFVDTICEAFFAASDETRQIAEDRQLRAQFAYRMLQSMKSLPGFSDAKEDIDLLRNWVAQARELAREADRRVITDQKIGEILAYAPADPADGAWPTRSIRDLIDELSSEEIEMGVCVSRFNMRGVFSRPLYEGGTQERAFAGEYRRWAEASRQWPRTNAMLRRIASDWDRTAEQADTEAQLDQLRD